MKLFIIIFMITLLVSILPGAAKAEPGIEIIGEFDTRPGNPAVTPDGDIYFTMHPFDDPVFKVMKLQDGVGEVYPNPEISKSFSATIGIQADEDGVLWILDMGSENKSPRLFGWDTDDNEIHRIFYMPEDVLTENSFLQDFAIDEDEGVAFIADMGRADITGDSQPAIIVVNLQTGQSRRVLP